MVIWLFPFLAGSLGPSGSRHQGGVRHSVNLLGEIPVKDKKRGAENSSGQDTVTP